jgi:hypothetical protein
VAPEGSRDIAGLLRVFGGLSGEAAEVLRISREAAQRDWKLAKAWLLRELTGELQPFLPITPS